MSKVHFQLGTQNHVQISLPSKMYGDGDVFAGKAKIRVDSLVCSQPVKIHRDKLTAFFADVAKVYETLKGNFTFESEYNTFSLRGEMTRKGQVRVLVQIGYEVRNHPDYTEWRVEAAFNFEPDTLQRVLENQTAT
jgi:hypothetical protein